MGLGFWWVLWFVDEDDERVSNYGVGRYMSLWSGVDLDPSETFDIRVICLIIVNRRLL